MPHRRIDESRCLTPSDDLVIGETQATVRVVGAQEFEFMRGEIDDEKTTTRPQNMSSFRDGRRRIV